MPTPNHVQRDAAVLKAIVGGANYRDAGAGVGLSQSRARIVVQRLATKLVRESRLDDPKVVLQYVFKAEEFTGPAALWHERLEKYLSRIEESFDA